MSCYQNGYFLIISLNMSFLLVLRHGCDECYVIRGCTISKVVSRTTMNIIFWKTYRVSRWLQLSRVVSHVVMDAWKDMSPMGPKLRDSGCVSLGQICINAFDISFHGIAHFGHWWTWTCVCWSCECFSVKLVTDEYWVFIENLIC